jgi:predicted DNA-binding protein
VTVLTVRLPDALSARAAALAERQGMTLEEYVGITLASHLGAVEEMERYFDARAKRTSPQEALRILDRAGVGNPPLPGDEVHP